MQLKNGKKKVPKANKMRLLSFIKDLKVVVNPIIEMCLSGEERGNEIVSGKICKLIEKHFKTTLDLEYLYRWMGISEKFFEDLAYEDLYFWKDAFIYWEIHDGGMAITDHLTSDFISLELEYSQTS